MRRRTSGRLLLAASLVAAAAPPPADSRQEPTPQFRVAVDLVTVDVFAHRGGRPIEGLAAADFVVRDNDVEQRIESMGTTDSAHIVIGLDLSGSVDGTVLERLRAAVRSVLDQLTEHDRVSVFTFADRLRVLARAATPRPQLGRLLDQMQATGSTTLHDALVLGSALVRADGRPTVFLFFTDGQDTASWTTSQRTLDVLRRTNAVVYPVGAGLPGALIAMPGTPYLQHPTWVYPTAGETLLLLDQVARTTGGEFLRVGRDDRLATTFAAILAQYRQRYLLSFTPTGVASGGWHRLDVRLRTRPGTVVAREGYMARSQ